MWPHCHQHGIAIIEYGSARDVDLSAYPRGEPKTLWSQLAPSQRASLKRFVYEMAVGDVIYVKKGADIVGRGVVASPYRFDARNRIRARDGTPWQHQRRVTWMEGFPETPLSIGRQQVVTLVPLTERDVELVSQAVTECFANESDIEGTRTEARYFKTARSRRLRSLAFEKARGICCVCRRDYSKVLAGRGVRALHVHHREQLSAREMPSLTKLDDLAVVCASCHMLIHLDPKNAIAVETLREMLESDAGASSS
jgi:hypothetical protein